MRSLLAIATLALGLAFVPAAVASVVHAEGSSTAAGVKFTWAVDYDTASNNLSFTCTQVSADDGVTPIDPQPGEQGGVIITLANGQTRTFDCFTAGIVNQGTQVQKVNLKVDTVGRWSGFTLNDYFTPPTQ